MKAVVVLFNNACGVTYEHEQRSQQQHDTGETQHDEV